MIQRPAGRPWYQSHFTLHLAGNLALFAAFPPLGWWPLAWIAPWFWFMTLDDDLETTSTPRTRSTSRKLLRFLPRPGWTGWGASCIFWLLLLQGVRLAHWGTYFGWFAMAIYLGLYFPIFLDWTRRLVVRTGLPLALSAAITWTVLEWTRGHVITGFSMGLLAHTQAYQPYLVQVADLGGAYLLSFLIILVSGCAYRAIPWIHRNHADSRLGAACSAGLLLITILGYGHWALQAIPQASNHSSLQVGLVQGSIDTQFGEQAVPDDRTFDLYNNLTLQFGTRHPDVDLIIWPESMFSFQGPELLIHPEIQPPADLPLDRNEFQRRAHNHNENFYRHTRNFALGINRFAGSDTPGEAAIHFILGSNCWEPPPDEKRFNSALLVEPGGQILHRYHKMHRVMFGEYIPGGKWFPWLYQFSPIGSGLTPGKEPIAFQVKDWIIAPNICFESTVPHLIRRQCRFLRSRGQPPNALVTITNDGWFWGSSMLDLHLACGIFRAVENRIPLLIAANTGISAWIDQQGRLRAVGPRRQRATREDAVIQATLQSPSAPVTPYQSAGDWPWTLLGLLTGLAAYGPFRNRSDDAK